MLSPLISKETLCIFHAPDYVKAVYYFELASPFLNFLWPCVVV